MELRLLGPLEVLDDHGQPVVLSGQRPRALLTVLTLRANHVVTVEKLTQALWGIQAPRLARESLHVFVHQIRKTLRASSGPGTAARLETHGAGYLLRVQPEHVDIGQFGRLADQARATAASGDQARAWELFSQALALWRGPALADFAHEPFAKTEIPRLEERRLAAITEQMRLGLDLGRHADLVGELEALVAEHPHREGLRELLMLALYRSGRQAGALEVYRAGRARSVDELGLEPGEGLQQLERAILIQEPWLRAPQTHEDRRPITTGHAPSVSELTAPTSIPSAATPEAAGIARRTHERKPVTVLVTGVVFGARADPEDIRHRLNVVTDQVGRLVARYGGIVQAGAMGRLLAVFGAQRSHEDDPERAVRAALEIGVEVRPASGWVCAGVATGEVVVDLDRAARQERTPGQVELAAVAGNVVETASGLEAQAAPGTVLVAPTTYRVTRKVITYQPAGAAAWRALAPRARTGARHGDFTGPLIERKHELAMLAGVTQRFLRERRPQLITLVSEPGMGKSRLVAELARLVDHAPELVTWRTGRCPPYGQGGLWALAEVVKAQVGIMDTDSAGLANDKLNQAVTHLLGDDAAQSLPHLRVLLGPAHPPTGIQASELFAGWSRWFVAMAMQRPTVVVLEDLQWADDVLLDFIDQLSQQVGPVPLMIVGTGRLELLDRRESWGGGKRDATTIALPPLSREGTAALLDALLGELVLPAETRDALLACSGGNPLYVEEYVRMLHEQDGALTGPDETLPLPETVQQLVAARIDTLPVADKLLLQDAAVLGDTIWVGALATVSGRDSDQVENTLSRLERLEFLRRVRASSVEGEREYAFRHALIRDAAYARLIRSERVDKHQRTAAWIESLNPELDERVEQLAYHYKQALMVSRADGQPLGPLADRARVVFCAAGDRAVMRGSLAVAVGAYQAALEVWPPGDPGRHELLYRLGQTLVYAEHSGEGLILQARDAFEAAEDHGRVVEAELMLSQLARGRADFAATQRHLDKAVAMAAAAPLGGRATVLATRAMELSIIERYEEAVQAGQEVLSLVAGKGLSAAEGTARAAIGLSDTYRGDLSGVAHCQQAFRLLQQAQDPRVSFMRWALVCALWYEGDLQAMAKALADARAHSGPSDAVIAFLDTMQACLDVVDGQWEAAGAFLARLLARMAARTPLPQAWGLPLRARIRLGCGDLDGALEDATAALTLGRSLHEPRLVQVPLALLGRIHLTAGRRDQAGECLAELLEAQRSAQSPTMTSDQAELLIGLDRPASSLPVAPPTHWHSAVLAHANRDYAVSAKLYAALGSRIDAATVKVRAARELAAAGAFGQARAEASEAMTVWQQAGASMWLDEASALAVSMPAAC